MFRANYYNEGFYYNLVPVGRLDVVPGQTVDAKVQVKVQTKAFLQNILSGGVAHIYAFYTPYRLLWEDWIDFATDPQTALTIPVAATPWPELFEHGGQNALGRRAYKLIYNQFFGSDQWPTPGQSWYADITLDTDVTGRSLRTTDQMGGKVMMQNQAPDRIYDAPVTGTAPNQVAEISLNDLRQEIRLARSDRRSNMTGDKYVDAMRRLGVNLDWRVQMAPEFLCQSLVEFDAKRVRSSYGDDTALTPLGRAYAHYEFQLGLDCSRKYFAEHGIIWFLIGVRPYILNLNSASPVSSQIVSREYMFWGDNQEGVSQFAATQLGIAGSPDVGFFPNMQWYNSGQNLMGSYTPTQPWVTVNTPADLHEFVYPATIDTSMDTTLNKDFGLFSRMVVGGPTPVKKGRM